MSEEKILACDLGTSQCKVSVFGTDGKLLASAAEGYSPFYGPGNQAEQDPEVWWQAFVKAAQQVLTPGESYACLALTGQMSACLPVDHSGSPLRPAMIWADQRATDEADIFEKTIGRERLYAITGNPPSATYTGPKVLWMKRHEPDLFARTACFLQPKDFLAFRLTGSFVTDHSDASCTSLFDLQARTWYQPLLDELDLPREKFPEAVPSTEIVGRITSDAASATGIQAGTPVVIGGGDGPTAAVGAGVIEEGSGYISLGSSAWISYCQPEPLYDRLQRTFNYCHVVPGMYALTGTMQSAGASYAWCIENLFPSDKLIVESLGGDLDELLNKMVEAIPPGAEKLTFLPYLVGERTPYWNPYASGAFIGLRPHHTRYHLVRSVIESIGLHLRLIQEVFAEQGVSANQLIVIGGGSRNKLLMRICSDIFQKQLLYGMLTTGATSFGAAIAGAVGIGLLNNFLAAKHWFSESNLVVPNAAQSDLYNAAYARFQKAYRLLEPLFCED